MGLKLYTNLKIRYKLLIGYSFVFLLAIVVASVIANYFVRKSVEANIESELTNTTDTILSMVQTTASASIKNHLRAITESNLEIVESFYGELKNDFAKKNKRQKKKSDAQAKKPSKKSLKKKFKKAEKKAKDKISRLLLSQKIGDTGYIYVIDSKGVIRVHPKKELIGADLTKYNFAKQQIKKKKGYIEYDWKNPDDLSARPKALYMDYFKPWDWIISASSYRNEFSKLINVDDFRSHILSLQFGKTGYSFIMDSQANVVIHPKLKDTNLMNSRDATGREFIREICDKKIGKLTYPWKDPGNPEVRYKLVIFNYIPELDWIIVSSSYVDEFYEPFEAAMYLAFAAIIITLLLAFLITSRISNSITMPLQVLMKHFSSGADGDLSARMVVNSEDEIGMLARYFNTFMAKLEKFNSNLKREVAERKSAEEAMRESEIKYRSIFENAMEGIFQSYPDGKIFKVNPALAHMLGYTTTESLIETISQTRELFYDEPEKFDSLNNKLTEQGRVSNFEVEVRKHDGSLLWVSISARVVLDSRGKLQHIEGSVADINERKKVENSLIKSREELEHRVAERTAELSSWVKELRQYNYEMDLLTEMNDHLQVCHAMEETYPVITHYTDKLFSPDAGALFMFNENRSLLEAAVSWGNYENTGEQLITQEDCWALRKGKTHMIENPNEGLLCNHLHDYPGAGYICVPIIAQGEVIGLLHLQNVHSKFNENRPATTTMTMKQISEDDLEKYMAGEDVGDGHIDSEEAPIVTSIEKLALTVAEHLGLALANLKLRDSLRRQSIRDPLTGLFNRRYMEESLERESSRAKRRKTNVGVLMMDIDFFKRYNDTFGHEAGDVVLETLAQVLLENTRGEDIPCRYGGEEFILILPDVNLEIARKRAELLRKTVSELEVRYEGKELDKITISIGVAIFPTHGITTDSVVNAADAALYRAKEGGRNRVELAK